MVERHRGRRSRSTGKGCICFQILFQHQRPIRCSHSLLSQSHRNRFSGPKCVRTRGRVQMGLEHISLGEMLRSRCSHLAGGRGAYIPTPGCLLLLFADSLPEVFEAGSFLFHPKHYQLFICLHRSLKYRWKTDPNPPLQNVPQVVQRGTVRSSTIRAWSLCLGFRSQLNANIPLRPF